MPSSGTFSAADWRCTNPGLGVLSFHCSISGNNMAEWNSLAFPAFGVLCFHRSISAT